MNFRKYLGYYSHEKYRNWLRSIFIHKNIDINITFKQLYIKTNKILIIAGSCLNKQTTHYYHHISNPNMQVVKALEITSCIPLIFEPIKWKNDILVDGGLSESFPIYILDKDNHIPNTREKLVNYDPNKYSHNFSTLGIKIMTEDNNTILNVNTVKELLFSIISMLQTQLERDNIRASYWNQTIKIVIPKNFSWNYIHIANDQRLELVEYGKKYANEFLLI
jgi:predicted acylesterase/phospholipase RssA